MTTIFSDDFNRADNASLGGTWVDITGDMQVKSNQMFASGNSFSRDGQSVGSADYYVSIDQTFDGTQSNWAQPVGRASTTGTAFDNCYFGYIQNETGAQDFAQLYKRVAGVQTQLGSTYNYTATATETRTWKLSMVGTAIKLLEDGVERISATDSAHTTEGYHGVRLGSGFYIDNYLLEDTNTGTNVTVSATVLEVTSSVQAPSFVTDQVLDVSVLDVTSSIQAPTITAEGNVTITPTLLELTASIIDPFIDAISDVTITPTLLELTSSVIDPTVTGDGLVTPDVATLTSSVIDPTIAVVANVTITPSVLTLTASLQSPTISFASVRDWYEQNSSNWYTKL